MTNSGPDKNNDSATIMDALPGREKTPSPFVLLDAVRECMPTRLIAVRRFERAPLWQGLECLAQAAALHQRVLANFERHAFLLSYDECCFPEDTVLDGQARVTVELLGQSRDAAGYEAVLEFPDNAFHARLHIGLTSYDARFQADTLTARYKELFTCLLHKSNVSR